MKNMLKKTIMATWVVVLSISCSQTEEMKFESNEIIVKCIVPASNAEEVFATKINGSPQTKATVSQTDFFWDEGDMIGIIPTKGSQIYFEVDEGAGTSTAIFDGGAWALKSDATYWSYYPFYPDFFVEKSSVPVSFEGQSQNGNDNTSHCGKYWCLYSAPAYAQDNALTFKYDHLTSFFKTYVTLPAGIYTRITYSSDSEIFIKNGYFDLSSDTPSIVGEEFTKEISLDLNNVEFSIPTELVSYLVVAPVNVANVPITVTIYDNQGISYSYSVTKTKAMAPATTYAFRANAVNTSVSTAEAANAAFAAGATEVNFSMVPGTDVNLTLPNTADDVNITFPNEDSDINITVSYPDNATSYPANLDFYGPNGVNLIFNTPNTTINLIKDPVEEKIYSSVRSATAMNTLVVNSSVNIGNLSVVKGGVAVYGKVAKMNLMEDEDDAVISVHGVVAELVAEEDDYSRIVYNFKSDQMQAYCLANFDKDGNGTITHDEMISVKSIHIDLGNDLYEDDTEGADFFFEDASRFRNLDVLYAEGVSYGACIIDNLTVKTLVLKSINLNYTTIIGNCTNLKTVVLDGGFRDLSLFNDIMSLVNIGNVSDFSLENTGYGPQNIINDANYVDIIDDNFREYCLDKFDDNEDYCIIDSEISDVSSINCSGMGIRSMQGLEYFTSLSSIDCSNNSISGTLDVSHLRNTLTSLDCSKNDINEIKIWSGFNPANYPNFTKDSSTQYTSAPVIDFVDDAFKSFLLYYVDTDGDGEINIEEASAITELNLFVQKPFSTTEDLRNFPNLTSFTITSNIPDFDLPSCTIDVSEVPNLKSLTVPGIFGYANYKHVSTTVILNNPVLENVTINGSTTSEDGITSIDLTGCTNLKSLSLRNNRLTVLDVSPCTKMEYLFTTGNPDLAEIWLGQNQTIKTTFSYDTSISSVLRVGVDIKFVDPVAKNICLTWDTDGNGSLSFAEAAAVTSLGGNFYGNENIVSFNEFKYFTGVTNLNRLNSEGDGVFEGCNKLQEITLPSNLASIGESAFSGCTSVESMTITYPYFLGIDEVDDTAFQNVPATAALYVPSAILSNYQNSNFWTSRFGTISAIID